MLSQGSKRLGLSWLATCPIDSLTINRPARLAGYGFKPGNSVMRHFDACVWSVDGKVQVRGKLFAAPSVSALMHIFAMNDWQVVDDSDPTAPVLRNGNVAVMVQLA